MALSGAFTYVYIPADPSAPIETREGDKSGGLSDDFLAEEARRFFFEQSGGSVRAATLENATPEEKRQLADQIRKQAAEVAAKASGGAGAGGGRMTQLDDDALINMVKSTQATASCEIIAVTVPTPLNSHIAVSIYGADDAQMRDLAINPRATELMEACGHSFPLGDDGKPGGIRGDVFVGRYHDNEAADIWERVDFTADDTRPGSDWCATARTKGGGGGLGKSGSAPSLSGMMSQAFGGAGGGAMSAAAAGTGIEVNADGYKWSQTEDEVELKFSVAKSVKAKYVKVNFGRKSLKITAAGQTLVNGETGGEIVVDECTYTIQDDDKAGRELCVTLGKKNESAWAYAVVPK